MGSGLITSVWGFICLWPEAVTEQKYQGRDLGVSYLSWFILSTSGRTEVEGDISFLRRCIQADCTGPFIFVVKGWGGEEGIGVGLCDSQVLGGPAPAGL